MDCLPKKKNGRCREVAVSGDWTVFDNRKERPYLVLYSHIVVTAFDCKDENSFGFSLFVDVRFKLCIACSINLD